MSDMNGLGLQQVIWTLMLQEKKILGIPTFALSFPLVLHRMNDYIKWYVCVCYYPICFVFGSQYSICPNIRCAIFAYRFIRKCLGKDMEVWNSRESNEIDQNWLLFERQRVN